jgi:alpha-1,2-mannosyltransferase
MTFMWTLHRPGRNHTTVYFSGVYWNFLDLKRFWVGQLASGWYPLTFLCFLIGAASWLHLSTPPQGYEPDEISLAPSDIEDYPPELLDDQLARA